MYFDGCRQSVVELARIVSSTDADPHHVMPEIGRTTRVVSSI
jgi:hypothetical protein